MRHLIFILFLVSSFSFANPTSDSLISHSFESLDFPNVVIGNDSYLPNSFNENSLSVQDLITQEGDVLLFRYQAGRYVPNAGSIGEWSSREVLVSSSFAPRVMWAYYPQKVQNYVVIFRQNIDRDFLMYPKKNSEPHSYAPLTRDTKLNQIAFYNEIKIPPQHANVIAEFPREYFHSLLDSMNADTLTLNELVNRIKNDPQKLDPIHDRTEVRMVRRPFVHFVKKEPSHSNCCSIQ